jgi:hypothetical protein
MSWLAIKIVCINLLIFNETNTTVLANLIKIPFYILIALSSGFPFSQRIVIQSFVCNTTYFHPFKLLPSFGLPCSLNILPAISSTLNSSLTVSQLFDLGPQPLLLMSDKALQQLQTSFCFWYCLKV